jgi:hypothetical protein
VIENTSKLAINAPVLIMAGFGFDTVAGLGFRV